MEINERLKNFMSMRLAASHHTVRYDSWLFCPFVKYKVDVFVPREKYLGVVEWYSGIGYMYGCNKFHIMSANPYNGVSYLWFILEDFYMLNFSFDGTADSIIKYLDDLNQLDNPTFNTFGYLSTDKGCNYINLSRCDRLNLLERVELL